VLVQVALQGERLVAPLTFVVLEGGVRLHVSAQVGPVCERLAAVRAAEGLVPGVGAKVALEQPWAGEGFAAHSVEGGG
jgi:hypothetical protein